MTVNLHLVLATEPDYAVQWAGLCAFGTEAMAPLDDATVTAAAKLLNDAPLSNGQSVFAYVDEAEGEEFTQGSYVAEFGPSLLAPETLTALRELLAAFPQALAMVDHCFEAGLSVIFNPSTHHLGAYLKGTTSPADQIEFNCCKGTMEGLVDDLCLVMPEADDIAFEDFALAVQNRSQRIEPRLLPHLKAFVAYGRAKGATAIYWA